MGRQPVPSREFTRFVKEAEPRLSHAFFAAYGPEVGSEVTADSLAYAWEHWDRVEHMENPAGYLYRVGRSRGRVKWRGALFSAQPAPGFPEMEPGLPKALKGLSENQRITVFLVHAMGWTRDQAIDYLAANTALSLHEVTTETDRYISWPAQALPYKLGELKIKELRSRAEAAHQEHFDLREFHDAVLRNGSVPLATLEEIIDHYIKENQSGVTTGS